MLKQKIQEDIKNSMKQGNQLIVDVLRMASSAINAKEKEKRYKLTKEDSEIKEAELMLASQLTDEEIILVIASEVKKRKDAIELYLQGGRPELADNEKKEIEILQQYLPEQLPIEELKEMVKVSIKNMGALSVKDTGKIMADLIPIVKGRADNSEISKIIKELLNG